ncbi:MAG: FG-GAP repeat domain-containing protein [Phycisphaerales bacterium]
MNSRITLTTGLALFLTTSAFAQISFDPAINYATGVRPAGIAAGHFNQDAFLDLAVVTDPQNQNGLERLQIFNGNGDGTYTPGLLIVLPNSSSPAELAAADFDNDSDDDFVVVLEDFNQVMTITNNGNGSFTLGATAPIGSNARGLDMADYDNDGDVDLVIANRDSNTATVLTNAGNGTFTSTTLAAGVEPRAAAFIDINSDGRGDVAISNHDSRSISLYTNSGGSAFTLSGTLAMQSPFRPEGLRGGDLNNDGMDDLAVAAEGNGVNVAFVYLNQGGSLGPAAQYNTNGVDTSGMLIADLDCDDALDLITLNDSSSNVSLLRNNGNGTFAPGQTLAIASEPGQGVAADLDGDGDVDLAVTNKLANSFSVLLNQTCEEAGVASLTDAAVTFGSLVSGTFNSMIDSDDVYYEVQSAFGFLSSEPNRVSVTVGAATASTPSLLDIAIEARTNNPNGTATVRIRNWNTNGLDSVGSYAIGTAETVQMFNDVSATNHVRSSDGRIELDMKHIIIATFSTSGFRSRFDQVEIATR